MKVSSILQRKGGEVACVDPQRPIPEVVQLLCERDIGAVVVTDDTGALAGIVSERDIVRALENRGPDLSGLRASDLMTTAVTHTSPATDMDQVTRQMTAGRFRHMPVLDEGRLVGIVSIGDAVRARIEALERETEALQRYISG